MVEPWTSKPSILFSKDTARYFVPTDEMTYVEKINAGTRFLIYGSILLYLIRGDSYVFFIPIIGMIVIYFLIKWGNGIKEIKEEFTGIDTEVCQLPSIDNPFMNVLPNDDRKRAEACQYTENTKEKIEDAFYSNLYLDTNDIYGKNNSQRQYYTMPSTSIPNEQSEFASWLYNCGPSMKQSRTW